MDARPTVLVVEYPVYPDGPFFHDRGYGCLALSYASTISIAHPNRIRPASLSCTVLRSRMNNSASNSRSNATICLLSAGWVICQLLSCFGVVEAARQNDELAIEVDVHRIPFRPLVAFPASWYHVDASARFRIVCGRKRNNDMHLHLGWPATFVFIISICFGCSPYSGLRKA